MMDLHAFIKDQFIHDTYLYLASAGSCLLLSDWATRLADRSEAARRLVWAAASVLLVSYAGTLWNVQRYWHDDYTLFARCIEEFPQSRTCHTGFALTLQSLGDLEGAARELKISLSLDPDPEVLYRLGMVDARLGRNREAVSELSGALRLMRGAPTVAYVTLAELYDAQGDVTNRDEVLEHTRSLPDGDKAVGLAYARIQARHGDLKGAENVLHDLVRRYPDDSRSWTALGLLLADDNRGEESLRALDRTQQISPGDPEPHFFAARVLHAMGRDHDALQQCRRALALAPGYDQARTLRDEILRNPARG